MCAALNVLANSRAAVPASSEAGQAFIALEASLNELLTAIGTVVGNSSAVVGLATADGNAVNLNAPTLAVTDQFLSAYLEEMVPVLETFAPRSMGGGIRPAQLMPCPQEEDPELWRSIELVCRKQTADQQRTTASETNQRAVEPLGRCRVV